MTDYDDVIQESHEAEGELPQGWTWATIKQIVEVNYGKALPQGERDSNGEIPVYGSSGITGKHSQALSYGKTIIIGRKGAAGAVHLSKTDCWVIDTAYFVNPPEDFSIEYLYYVFGFLNLVSLDKSTAIPSLSRDDLYAQVIPIPPSNEQRRIVEAIESLFTQLDAGVAALKRLRANLKRYKAAVLKAACEGRLVAQDPDDEPASALLQRILTERRAKWEAEQRAKGKDPRKLKYEEPAAPDDIDLPDDLPELPELPVNWTWVTLGQLAWSVRDGPHYSPKYTDEGIPFISGGNIRPSGIDFESAKHISPELHAELSKRCKPELGDILYTKGGTTGIARVNTYDFDFNVWVHVAVLKLVDSIERFYIQHTLNSPLCYVQSQRYTHGVGNQDLGLTRMVKILLALPPLNEQNRIIEEIDRRISILDEIENAISTDLSRADRLRQAILKQAFAGRLVAQDANDEAAGVLLERVRAGRKAGGKR